jgi:hypothetical protein
MLATEVITRLSELVNEFGDQRIGTPDQMEPKWIRDFADIEFDPEREVIMAIPDDMA